MAKAKATKKAEIVETPEVAQEMVTLAELAERLEMEPHKLRKLIRDKELATATETGIEGFGPKKKYLWTPEEADEIQEKVEDILNK